MPMIDLTCPEGALDPERRAEAVEKLTSALLHHEGATDNQFTRGMTWVLVHELPADAVNIRGRPSPRPLYRLFITVPQGTLLQGPGPVGTTARRNLVREATEILLAAEGTEYSPEEALRVYCVIREVDDGYWGGFGTTFRMQDIVAMANPAAGDTALAAEAREAAAAMLASDEVEAAAARA